jgi:hypothetical protein
MRVINHEQGTQEWLNSRLGCPSGSGFDKLIQASGKPSTQAEGYINQLIAELMTGQSTEIKVTEWMQRGTELEPMARNFYELASGNDVQEVGFCKHDKMECGVSPDGLIGEDGGLEIKCPTPATHIAYLRAGVLPTKYKQQVMGCMWITGRQWWDFVSYHETMPALIVRVERDDDYITLLADEVSKAVDTIQLEVNRLRKMQ